MENEEVKHVWAKIAAKRACKRLGELAAENGITVEDIADKTGYTANNIGQLIGGRYTARMDIVFVVLKCINELSGKTYNLQDIQPKAL
jgi:hypothetical protein